MRTFTVLKLDELMQSGTMIDSGAIEVPDTEIYAFYGPRFDYSSPVGHVIDVRFEDNVMSTDIEFFEPNVWEFEDPEMPWEATIYVDIVDFRVETDEHGVKIWVLEKGVLRDVVVHLNAGFPRALLYKE